jgi:RecA-family ATPase
LLEELWGHHAVGIIGGAPKASKSWLALDMAVSVASGTPCLGRFHAPSSGPALIYLAEDDATDVRDRVEQICAHRRLSFDALDVELLTTPCLYLDMEQDCQRLDATVAALKPRLLVLDPLVRLHRTLDENSSGDIARLLGFLRELNRRHELALVLVHHMSKRPRKNLGQSLRGSSDLHAWLDSACYLVRNQQEQIALTIEHRAASAPKPIRLRLVQEKPAHLEILDSKDAPPPLTEQVRQVLLGVTKPLTRDALRKQLCVNNARLGEALHHLETMNLIYRSKAGWSAATNSAA